MDNAVSRVAFATEKEIALLSLNLNCKLQLYKNLTKA